MIKNKKLNFNIKGKNYVILLFVLTGIICLAPKIKNYLSTKDGILEDTINPSSQSMSALDFNKLPYLVSEIHIENTNINYIVRSYPGSRELAFNDYVNNKFYFFKGYEVRGCNEDFIFNTELGLFMINKDTQSIDNFTFDNAMPEVTSSVNIENIDKFIGTDIENSLLFAKTIENDVVCYDMKSNTILECSVEGLTFSEIYNKLNLEGDIMDFFFLDDYILSDGNKTKGILITYHDGSKMVESFYQYDANNFYLKK